MTAIFFSSLYCSVQSLSRVRLCDPMDCRTPGLPVHHQLPESTQTPVHRVGDAIQPSHPLPPSVFPSIRVFYRTTVQTFSTTRSVQLKRQAAHKHNSRNLASDSFWGTGWEGAECITRGDRITILISIPQN